MDENSNKDELARVIDKSVRGEKQWKIAEYRPPQRLLVLLLIHSTFVHNRTCMYPFTNVPLGFVEDSQSVQPCG